MKKISIIFMMLVLILNSILIITPNYNIINAETIQPVPNIDTNLIYNVSEYLSYIITSVYDENELAKGREFGTEGEWVAANYTADIMADLNLYDPTTNPNNPYRENIINRWYRFKNLLYGSENLTDKITVHEKKLIINDAINNTTFEVDCYIHPLTNNTRHQPQIPKKNKERNEKLTYNFTGKALKIYELPIICECNDTQYLQFINETYENVMTNFQFDDDINISLYEFLKTIFENQYNFTFENIDPDDNSTWPSYMIDLNITEDFVTIEEAPEFNPNIYTEVKGRIKLHSVFSLIISFLSYFKDNSIPRCYEPYNKAAIKYDYSDEAFNTGVAADTVIPTIFINGSIGEILINNLSRYTVDFYLNQSYDENIISYNIIGQINGTNQGKTVILDSLYDSLWCQGTSDSAIGCGIVLAIAKQMKELENNGIIPKYKTKFILFGGEEWGYKGAKHYVEDNLDENIKTVIDLNQLGMKRPDPQKDPPLIMNLVTNKVLLQYLLDTFCERNRYKENTGYDYKGVYSRWGGPSNDNAFAFGTIRPINTVLFLKDYGWYYHHRDGCNHTEGDVMKNIDWNDINETAELVWNVTKYYTYDPDVWFDGNPTFQLYDTTGDGNFDCLNVSYTIDTLWPNEKVSVRLVLYPKFKLSNPLRPILYRIREDKSYIVTSDGMNGYINVTLPTNFPKGEYIAKLYLLNSNGDIELDTVHLIGIKTLFNGLEITQLLAQHLFINIFENLSKKAFEIRDYLGIDILDWIEKLPNLRNKRVRDIFIDILGYYIFCNESHISSFQMHPPNQPPNTPDQPIDLGEKWGSYRYKTKTSDPDSGDKIRYQWNWNGINGHWSIAKYDSNEDHIKRHIWWTEGEKKVKVRAKNPWSPNVFSNWSQELTVNIGASCSFNTATSQSSQNNMNNPYVINSFDPFVIVAGGTVTYQGSSCGVGASPTYEYLFQDTIQKSNEQNPNHTFNTIGNKYVNLTVSQEEISVYYNTTVNVVNASPCFNMNRLGAKPNQDIIFNDTTISKHSINNWTWDFDDGHINYSQNVSHNFSQAGVYNVSLNVTDSNGESFVIWQIIHIETNQTDFITASYSPVPGILGCNITLSAEFWDNNESGIDNAFVNISYPNGTTNNFSMYFNENSSFGYEYVFNDTMQVGWYYFSIWVTDLCGNSNNFSGCGFEILPAFGNSMIGELNKTIKDNISCSNFTVLVNGTAESISAYIQTNQTPNVKTKCMIYRVNDSTLVGTTEEKIISTGDEPDWIIYNFTGTKPSLTTDTKYILACWSNDTCKLFYDNVTDNTIGRYKNITYGSPPSPISWDGENSKLYSIYCKYSTIPEIISVSASPDPIGFGYNTTITAEIEHYYTLVDNITVNITYPDDTFVNNSMTKVDDDTFQYTFDDTWLVGQYNYSIWVKDKLDGNCSGSGYYSFNVSVNATVSVCTIKDNYGNNESINLTDPPNGSSQIGYEYLDDGKVLHIWNQFDSYYFNTSSGIQLTNHYNNYWSHNVLMLGYYNNNQWNLIYRTDELSGFNKDIESDNETYINVTIWKNLEYQGYDFRLAIRYNLGVDDNDLTVIPYIKNLGETIPYTLGFGWEMKDIQIDMTTFGDYINVNRTMYYLNQTLDNGYSDLPEAEFYIMKNITDSKTKSLYLKWNQSLNYKLCVKSRPGQYNAPVTLFIKVGTLGMNQEKYTEMYWYDAEQVTYYFNSHNSGEEWAVNPAYMVDGNSSNYALTTSDGDVELCNGNNCSGTDFGTISKVELRVCSYCSSGQRDTILRPVFGGVVDGVEYRYETSITADTWSQWFDITNDPFAPQTWTWTEIDILDCDVIAENIPMGPSFTLKCSKIEIRVTYTPSNYEPVISNPIPADDATGISISPMLNITVSDPDGDTMNITWFSNSSGSWTIFATNNSVNNGTYHQTFTNASENGKWYYWLVNVSDGEEYTESNVYKFYTGYQSKIKNIGSTNIMGYLLMQVQYYNSSSSTWVVADDTINETTPQTITACGQLGLDTIFNGNVNTTYLINNFGTGTYRIYTAFRDPDDDVLVCNDDFLMEDSYQFTVTTT